MIKEKLEALRLRAGSMMRERKERAAEKRAAKQAARAAEPAGHESRFWLLSIPAVAVILAAIVEWYWAILFCIEATGHIDWNWEAATGSAEPATSTWNVAFSAHLPVLIGLICATAPIVMISMVWLPVQFKMRGSGLWRRGSIIAVGILANILVIVSGTVVMNYNRQDQVREALVVEQSADAGRAAIGARLEFAREELRLATTNANPYLNQAANVGEAEWMRSYVAQARATNDARLPMLERATGAARRADQLRADIERLTVERATATPEAATAANVHDEVGSGLNTFGQYAEAYRPPFIALLCTLVGIFGVWWWVALAERMNPRDVLHSGWADEAHRIEDLRAEPALEVVGMRPTKEQFRDADTKEIIVDKDGDLARAVRPHTRKIKKDGKPIKVMVTPTAPPDERGADTDGGARIATTFPGVPAMNDLGAAVASDAVIIKDNVHSDDAGEAPESPNAGSLPVDEHSADSGQHKNDESDEQPHDPSEPPELPELSDEETLLALGGDDPVEQEPNSAESNSSNGALSESAAHLDSQIGEDNAENGEQAADEEVEVTHNPTPTPETRPERLLPASVAAE